MTFSLHVDAELWRSSVESVLDRVEGALTKGSQAAEGSSDGPPSTSGVVPVIEGNGLGLGGHRLAAEAARLGVTTIAVPGPFDAAELLPHFGGEILVRQPWDHRDALATRVWEELDAQPGRRVIRTVASTQALHRLSAQPAEPMPVVLQGRTSMHGAGLREPDLDALLADDTIRSALRSGRLIVRGAVLDLPSQQPNSPQVTTFSDSTTGGPPPGATNRVRETWGWAAIWIRALAAVEQAGAELGAGAATMWVTTLTDAEMADLHAALQMVPLRVLRGDQLWAVEPQALQAFGTVLAVQRVGRGIDIGDGQRRTPREGYVVVVGGGSCHGVGVTGPSGTTSLRQRAHAAKSGAMGAIGKVRSPYLWADRPRWFAEPPGPTASLVWLSDEEVREAMAAGHRIPAVGDQWLCRTNLDLASFDRVLGLD
ncbi:MAG: hypothetical protein ACH36H_07020 [Candidatus Nanopelagicales bacterium]